MNWFYASQGQRAGPVDDEGFARLVADGAVDDSTLVWHAGLPDWQPYAQARPAAPPFPGPAAAADPQLPAVGGAYPAQCWQCGRVFPADEVIRLEGLNVCAECKPLLLQKMRQGLVPAFNLWGGALFARFGGFWIRWGAIILDTLILSPALLVAYYLRIHFVPAGGFYSGGNSLPKMFLLQSPTFALIAAYEIFFVGRYAATPGKLICGLQIVRSDGSRVTYGRATGRFFARYLTKFSFYLGYLIAAFDSQKRALHDYVCDTRVIHKA